MSSFSEWKPTTTCSVGHGSSLVFSVGGSSLRKEEHINRRSILTPPHSPITIPLTAQSQIRCGIFGFLLGQNKVHMIKDGHVPPFSSSLSSLRKNVLQVYKHHTVNWLWCPQGHPDIYLWPGFIQSETSQFFQYEAPKVAVLILPVNLDDMTSSPIQTHLCQRVCKSLSKTEALRVWQDNT